MKIIMLGAPGAGKGTQAKMIADKYHVPHISTGDIFRANIKNGTELGMEAKKYMDQGLLVPDELTVKILLDRVGKEDCIEGYVLDGFPRTIPQAKVLDEALAELGESIDYAIDVDVPDENIVQRMSAAGADIIGAMIGVTSGGISGSKVVMSLEKAVEEVQKMVEAAKRENPEVMILTHGGPFADPVTAEYSLKNSGAVGYASGSSGERVPTEEAVITVTKKYKDMKI